MAAHATGTRVWQVTYGHGTVLTADRQHIRIEFDQWGMRTFATPLVKLERSVVPPPKKRSRRGSKTARTS